MIDRMLAAAAVAFLAWAGPAAAEVKVTVKVEDAPPPKELSDPVRALLDSKALTVSGPDGKPLMTVWPRKLLESKATADQAKAGLTYAQLDESVIVGAVRLHDVWPDYRKQRIKAGVYTLRLGLQPMDGDHMGTAPYNEFCLLSPAAKDQKPDLLEVKALHEMSSSSTSRNHPGIMLLFPNPNPGDAPTVEEKPNDTVVVNFKRPVTAGGQQAAIGFGIVVVGHSMSE